MSFLSKIFGGNNIKTHAVSETHEGDRNSREEILRMIELTEGELHEAEMQVASATDSEIKLSLESIVDRKKQALSDLKEKLAHIS